MQAANMTNDLFDSGAGQFSVSASGSLVYLPGGVFPDPERFLVWVDRLTGLVQPLAAPPRAYQRPRLSRDGRRISLWTQGTDRNVLVYDIERDVLTRVTSGRNARPLWTPDDKHLVFGSNQNGDENLYVKAADGSGATERLTTCDCLHMAGAWSSDGQTLIFVEERTAYRLMALSPVGDRQPRLLTQGQLPEAYPDLSPNGHWLAYASTDESGRSEVYVRPFPEPGPRHQISTNGGTAPAWSGDGHELFYTTALSVGGQAGPNTMMAVSVGIGPTFTLGVPRALFTGRFGTTAGIRGYDVTPDGRRFLMVQQKERPPLVAAQMIVVQNWVEELTKRLPTKR